MTCCRHSGCSRGVTGAHCVSSCRPSHHHFGLLGKVWSFMTWLDAMYAMGINPSGKIHIQTYFQLLPLECFVLLFLSRLSTTNSHSQENIISSSEHPRLLPVQKSLAQYQGGDRPSRIHVSFCHMLPRESGAPGYGAASWNFGRAPWRPLVLCQHRAPRGLKAEHFTWRLGSMLCVLWFLWGLFIPYHAMSWGMKYIEIYNIFENIMWLPI